ncbi:MAG: GAF domain-containing protein [Flavobacteriales bacterium]|nr:GAF domain-containing protein [Flavobacteriales bacterium]
MTLSAICITVVLIAGAVVFWSLKKYRALRKITIRNEVEQQAIREFASAIVTVDNLEEVLWLLMHSCIARVGFTDAVVYLYNQERGVLVQKAAFGPKNPRPFEILNPLEIAIGQGIVGTVAEQLKGEIIADTRKDPRYIRDDQMRLSEIAVPVTYKGELIGVIDSEHPEAGFFSESHLRLLETLGSMCAGKIAKLRALEDSRKYFNRLHTLFEFSPDFILLSAPDGHCKYANRSYLNYFGFDAESFASGGTIRTLNNEQLAEFKGYIRELSPSQPTATYFKQSHGSNGQVQWTLWNETGVFDERGQLNEVISVGRDITQLHDAQEAQRAYIKTLEQILQKNSHRVRQPVTQLMGITRLLEQSRNDEQELVKMLSFIRHSVFQLDSYTRELNDFVFHSSRS